MMLVFWYCAIVYVDALFRMPFVTILDTTSIKQNFRTFSINISILLAVRIITAELGCGDNVSPVKSIKNCVFKNPSHFYLTNHNSHAIVPNCTLHNQAAMECLYPWIDRRAFHKHDAESKSSVS
jgi:hypothetical protein